MEAIFNTATKTDDIKTLFKKVKQCQSDIEAINHSIKEVSTSKFYNVFGSEVWRKEELDRLKGVLKDTLKEYDYLLENLQIELTKERQITNNKLRYGN